MTYNEQRELDLLPARMTKLEAEIARLETGMADPDLYRRDPALFGRATERLATTRDELEAAEERWLVLEDKRDALASSEEHTSALGSLMRISSAVFCWKKEQKTTKQQHLMRHSNTY